MTEQEAKILASELEHHPTWRVPRINHGIDPLDGWYVVVELRGYANYRVLLVDHRYAMPGRMAKCRQTLEASYQQHQEEGHHDGGMLLVPLPTDDWLVMP